MKKIILSTFVFTFLIFGSETQAFLGSVALGGSCGASEGACVTNNDFQKFDFKQTSGGASCSGLTNFCATSSSIQASCDSGECPSYIYTSVIYSDEDVDYGIDASASNETTTNKLTSKVAPDDTGTPTTNTTTSSSSTTKLQLGSANYDNLLKQNIFAQKLTGGDSIETGRTMFQGTFVKLANMILGAFAIIWLCFLGIQFVVSRGNEEKMTELKKQSGWILLGLIVISIAEFAAFNVFDPIAHKLLDSTEASNQFSLKVMQIKTYFEYFVASVMLISLLISGYNLLTKFDTEETLTNEKKFAKSFALGMGLILLAEVMVKLVANGGSETETTSGIKEIAGLINFISTFLGVSAVFMLILASLYYIVSLGNEDQTGRAKNIIIGSIVGIIIAVSSYGISTFLI